LDDAEHNLAEPVQLVILVYAFRSGLGAYKLALSLFVWLIDGWLLIFSRKEILDRCLNLLQFSINVTHRRAVCRANYLKTKILRD
jgi:uncharacterized membrane protein